MKGNYNVSIGVEKNSKVNPDQYISMEIFKKTYDVYIERSRHELDVVMTALDAVCDKNDEILAKVVNPKVK